MSTETKKQRIREILKERDAILMAHYYQREEVQEIADFAGDSLGLATEASKTDAKVIVFAGVHFMAESAYMLSPQKTVLLPAMQAGCPMADMITPAKLLALKDEYPDYTVVCYVNSSAEVKAVADICCTSGNLLKVVESIENNKILMVPDKNLAKFAARHFPEKDIKWYDGFCPTHHRVSAEEIQDAREQHPQAEVIAHPECPPEVLKLADHICSTSGMSPYAQQSSAAEFIIATEAGILYQLRKNNPEKSFYIASKRLVCPNMKMTTLDNIIKCLEHMTNVVTVPEEVRQKAVGAVEKMIAIPRND
ncbi:quinolinate synthase NadA [Desulfurispira natronophila]|uniref:Quinolinate synthase n=1 Tax=Desulfurispira natronophila TaxID=682562 RepID=A0A7W7Y2S8_9BACT|nr:quinolinate synthase NadA [Desulfurispira natronophila]MBB5021050.1 quinolinate synthase [Desulfurispira natronophila]